MVFKHHSSARHSQRSGAAPQDEQSGTAAQDEGFGTPQQYDRPGDAPQYDRPGTSQRDERYGTSQQYERSGQGPQYERSGRADQAAGTPRGAIGAERGLPGGWLAELVLGLGTLVLGLIVAFHPTHSITILADLLGALMIISGVWHVIRSFHGTGEHRMWRAIGGVLFFLVGIFLLRHTGLTLAIIGLFAGFAFIIAGIAALSEGLARHHDPIVRIFATLFGLICLAAGIAAIVTPIHSLTRLAIVLGWAFVAMGIMHMVGAIASRRALRKQPPAGQVNVPGQRPGEARGMEGTYGASPEARAEASSAGHGRRPSRP
jgi:uncharacterized membrane protein HdeD (DUF308 family)